MITYEEISFEQIEQIKPLWERNRQYHEQTSEHFGHLYKGLCFEDRMKGFSTIPMDHLKVSIAKKGDSVVGYCISMAVVNGEGELASLHVLESERGQGIGEALTRGHLNWMSAQKCTSITVTVSQENASTIGFYKKLGFLPNTLQMIAVAEG